MYEQDILAFAKEGLRDGGREALLQRLCAAASAELQARLRLGVEPAAIKDSFVAAAGVLALSMYIAIEPDTGGSFKAGSLSVSLPEGRASAGQLRMQAEHILAAYLEDRGFCFKGVE